MKYVLLALLMLLQISCSKDCPPEENTQNQEELLQPNLTGKVWNDSDADGIQEATEEGLQDIEIEIINPETDQVIETTTTDAAGEYEIQLDTNLNFYLKLALGNNPLKYTPTSPDVLSDDFDDLDSDISGMNGFWTTDTYSSDVENNLDFGIYKTGTISGIVWREVDDFTLHPNNYDASEDILLENQLVRLFRIDLETGIETPYKTTRTDALGYYNFSFVLSSFYFVEFEIDDPNSHTFVSPNDRNDETYDSDVIQILSSTSHSTISGRTGFISVGPEENIEWVSAGAKRR